MSKHKSKSNNGHNQYGSDQSKTSISKNTSLKNQIPYIKNLEKDVLQCIIGQNKQVRQIITAIYRSIHLSTIKSNVLIIGNSGVGKTETIVQIAKRLHIPYTIEDATKYTKEGYYGSDVEEMVFNLVENSNGDIEAAEHGIIVIDEIDKKAGHMENDVSGSEVLKSLLKIVEGTTFQIATPNNPFTAVNFNTKNIIFIFSGAFSGLEKIRDKRLNTNPLGFVANNTSKEDGQSRFIKKDLVEYGMPEEFVGRVDTIIEMNTLTKEDLALILSNSKLSIFRRYQSELKNLGISLSYDRKLFELIAESSLSVDTGARELSNTVNYMFENILYDILSRPNKYKRCTLDLDIVHDNTKYTLS